MSAIKMNTTEFIISTNEVLDMLVGTEKYNSYSKDDISNIVNEVISEYKKAILSDDESDIVFDDELLFDDIYDYVLKNIDESLSTADVASIVEDIICYIEDVNFDKGNIQYN
jgi:hypothetical protein